MHHEAGARRRATARVRQSLRSNSPGPRWRGIRCAIGGRLGAARQLWQAADGNRRSTRRLQQGLRHEPRGDLRTKRSTLRREGAQGGAGHRIYRHEGCGGAHGGDAPADRGGHAKILQGSGPRPSGWRRRRRRRRGRASTGAPGTIACRSRDVVKKLGGPRRFNLQAPSGHCGPGPH